MRFEFNVGDLVAYTKKGLEIPKGLENFVNREEDLKNKTVIGFVVAKKQYEFFDQYFWEYTIQGSDSKIYHGCKEDQLKLKANWIKPEKINH